jgi:ATP-binding protein involved in chromosome partitioning
MTEIKRKLIVLSGKGGVGKSSIAINLAVWLAAQGQNVGLLDIDIHGPSVPKLLDLEKSVVQAVGDKITPILYSGTLKVMSIGLLLQNETDALIWRGPMKHNVIRQFVSDVSWGNLDYLVVDCPPGTGDEPLSIVQLLWPEKSKSTTLSSSPANDGGAVIITTPQQLAVVDVKKCITFCTQLNLPVLGVIENMSGFVCPYCNRTTDIFSSSGGKQMAQDSDVPFLGSIPMDVDFVSACDSGRPFIQESSGSPTAEALIRAFEPLLQRQGQETKEHVMAEQNIDNKTDSKGARRMRIAVPLTSGRLSPHFGHCEQFAVLDVDTDSRDITREQFVQPPGHQPGVLPQWLSGLNVDLIIASGMGQRAQQLFRQNNIDVVIGAPDSTPQELVTQYLAGQLQSGPNICDH